MKLQYFIFFKTIFKEGPIFQFLEVKNQQKNATDKCSL